MKTFDKAFSYFLMFSVCFTVFGAERATLFLNIFQASLVWHWSYFKLNIKSQLEGALFFYCEQFNIRVVVVFYSALKYFFDHKIDQKRVLLFRTFYPHLRLWPPSFFKDFFCWEESLTMSPSWILLEMYMQGQEYVSLMTGGPRSDLGRGTLEGGARW